MSFLKVCQSLYVCIYVWGVKRGLGGFIPSPSQPIADTLTLTSLHTHPIPCHCTSINHLPTTTPHFRTISNLFPHAQALPTTTLSPVNPHLILHIPPHHPAHLSHQSTYTPDTPLTILPLYHPYSHPTHVSLTPILPQTTIFSPPPPPYPTYPLPLPSFISYPTTPHPCPHSHRKHLPFGNDI